MSGSLKNVSASAMATATACWPDGPPGWVGTLAAFCDEHSQAEAARRLGRSTTLVNHVLKNRYTGDLSDVEVRVRTAFAETGPICPVLGEITGAACLKHQKTPFSPGNHIAVRLFKACRTCPHNVSRGGSHAQ